MIPTTLHLAWIGEEGTRPDACIESWREQNPGFEVRVWGNDELAAGTWRTRAAMKELLAKDLGAVCELVRYEVLATHGGIAVDALSLAARPIPEWLREDDAFALWADELDEPGTLSTALLGAVPGHPLFTGVLEAIAGSRSVTVGDPRFTVGAIRLGQTWRELRCSLSVHPSHYLPATYGDEPSYAGSGFVLGELLRPPRLDGAAPGHPAADPAHAARAQGAEAARVATATGPAVEAPGGPSLDLAAYEVADAPPLTSSFTLPPVEEATMTASAPLTWSEIAAKIQQIGAEDAPGQPPSVVAAPTAAPVAPLSPIPGIESDAPVRFRLVVATDWSSATLPLAFLRAYAAMIPQDAPVDLVFAVPHEPGEEDVACVRALLEGIGNLPTAGLMVESFDDAVHASCYGAVVPQGEPDALVLELGAALTSLHQLSLLVADPARLAQEPAPAASSNEGLRRRFSSYREVASGVH